MPIHPQDMASSMGAENIEPMYRRFTDTAGAHDINTQKKARENLRVFLLKILKRQFNLDYDVGDIFDNLPTCNHVYFKDIKL